MMFSKLTMILALACTLTLAGNVMAQTTTKKAAAKKASDKKTQVVAEDQKAEESKKNEDTPATNVAAQPAKSGSPLNRFLSMFSASYHGEFYFLRRDALSDNEDDKDLQDFNILHNPTVIIRPIKNWKLTATSEFTYTDVPGGSGKYINRHYRSLYLLTRENLLTEKENGFKLDATLGRRVFDAHYGNNYGNSRVNVNLSKKIGDHSTSLLLQYLANDPRKGQKTNTTWRHGLEIFPSFQFQLTDKISYLFNDDININKTGWGTPSPGQHDYSITHEMNVAYVSYQINDFHAPYFQFKYYHTENFTEFKNQEDYFEYYIGHSWTFAPKSTVTFEMGSEIFKNTDGRDFFSKKIKYPEFALYLDLSI